RLHHPRHLRGRRGAEGHRGEEPAAGPRLPRRLLRHDRRRRGVAARPAHPRVRPGHLDQPRAAAPPQAPAPPQRDRAPHRQDPGGRAHARAAVAVLQRRQGQGGAGARPRQARLRQARRHRQARRRPGDPAGAGPRGEGQGAGAAAVTVPAPPESDDDVPRFLGELGVPGIVDVHVHFLPERVLRKVWAYFDDAAVHYGMPWPIQYRTPEPERLATLRKLGVQAFAPLVYPHKPGMARWLTEWVTGFAADTADAVPTATLYPEPDVVDYLGAAVAGGARAVKVHVQVGAFDPRDPLLRPAWGLLADAGVPAVVHCGHGPIRG